MCSFARNDHTTLKCNISSIINLLHSNVIKQTGDTRITYSILSSTDSHSFTGISKINTTKYVQAISNCWINTLKSSLGQKGYKKLHIEQVALHTYCTIKQLSRQEALFTLQIKMPIKQYNKQQSHFFHRVNIKRILLLTSVAFVLLL